MNQYIVKYWTKEQTPADALTDTLSTTDCQELETRFQVLQTIKGMFADHDLGSEAHMKMVRNNSQLAQNQSLNRIAAKYSAMNCYWQLWDTAANIIKANNTQLPPA